MTYDKAKCKYCSKEFEALELLEHSVMEHDDKEAAYVLDQLGRMNGK